jgi:hypothetical protein
MIAFSYAFLSVMWQNFQEQETEGIAEARQQHGSISWWGYYSMPFLQQIRSWRSC